MYPPRDQNEMWPSKTKLLYHNCGAVATGGGGCGGCGGVTMDQWLDHRTGDPVVLGSNPGGTASELSQFRLSHVASVFRRRH